MEASPQTPSAITAVSDLLHRAEKCGASDIHLHRRGDSLRVDFRLDGLLAPVDSFPMALGERIIGRIKYLARLKTYQDHLPQEGRIGRDDSGIQCDVRLASYPTVQGEKLVLRLFQERALPGLSELGLPAGAVSELTRFLQEPSGLLLLTGPAGSGKSTTIYSCIQHLAVGGARHIVTVEDPVERVIPEVMQTEVNETAGLTFAKAARHLLRLDPQVFVLGEVRDEETADILIRAALTGHLVIATLHAGSCAGVFDRLFTLSSETRTALSAVDLVLNQRLLRRICPDCKGSGCGGCLKTGFQGRIPIVEWIRLTPALRRRVQEEGDQALHPEVPLAQAADQLVSSGMTTDTERRRVLGHDAAIHP